MTLFIEIPNDHMTCQDDPSLATMYASPGEMDSEDTADVKKIESEPEGIRVIVPDPRFLMKYTLPREDAMVGRVHVTFPPV